MLSLLSFSARGASIISDEETELYLQSVLKPIYETAGIPFNRNEIFIVDDPSLNAFVSDGNNMFIYTGTILSVDDTNELAGILAHETGHIKGGHILRQKLRIQSMQKFSLASLVLAGFAGMASGRGDVAAAIILGGQSSAISGLTAYQVEEERSADEASVTILKKLNLSPSGMMRFMKKIKKQNIMQGREELPYFRTHPMTAERIEFLENASKASTAATAMPQDKKLKRIQAKLAGFLLKPEVVRRKYTQDNTSIEALYANAIADLQEFKYDSALQKIAFLSQKEPENPHFMELKGQIYLERGEMQGAKEQFVNALKILPNSDLFKFNLAHAVLESQHTKDDLRQNEKILTQALQKTSYPYGWLLLSRTYDELGKIAERQYAAAKYSFETGEAQMAKKQLTEAKKHQPNSRLALKIDDLEHEIDAFLAKEHH